MKKILFSLVLFIIVLFSSLSNAQSKFTINVIGGYSIPMGDFNTPINVNTGSSLVSKYSEDWPYSMKNGFNVGAIGKLSLGKTGNFRLTFGLNYNSFSNTGTVNNFYYTAPPPPENFNSKSSLSNDGAKNIFATQPATRIFDPKVSLITISLGGEYAFLPKGNINPFVGLDITSSFWGGSFKFTPSDTGIYRDQTMKSEARFGLQMNGGCEFKLSKSIGLVAGLKCNFANLVGKGQDDASEIGPNEVDLGDKEHGIIPSRNVMYLQAYAGFSFYFGFPKTTPKK